MGAELRSTAALLPVALDRIEAALQSDGPDGLTAALLVRMAKIEPLPGRAGRGQAVEVEQAEQAQDLTQRAALRSLLNGRRIDEQVDPLPLPLPCPAKIQ
jgi:hypothetical protein